MIRKELREITCEELFKKFSLRTEKNRTKLLNLLKNGESTKETKKALIKLSKIYSKLKKFDMAGYCLELVGDMRGANLFYLKAGDKAFNSEKNEDAKLFYEISLPYLNQLNIKANALEGIIDFYKEQNLRDLRSFNHKDTSNNFIYKKLLRLYKRKK